MTGGWGPQATGGVVLHNNRKEGKYWIFYAIAACLIMPIFTIANSLSGGLGPLIWFIHIVTSCIGLTLGWRDGGNGRRFAQGHIICFFLLLLPQFFAMLAYSAAFWLAQSRRGHSSALAKGDARPSVEQQIVTALDPHRTLLSIASEPYGQSGGHVGWNDLGEYITAEPRGAMLVIGPPGSGKSSAVLIPSIIAAPAALVASSIKVDLLNATAAVRGLLGTTWHFDPGGDQQQAYSSIKPARWSPLVGLRTWDDARIRANRMAEPSRKQDSAQGGDGDHFIDRARDWVEVLLYAAALDNQPISRVAQWANRPDSKETIEEVAGALIFAASNGDTGAKIALDQHESLQDIPERERGSVKSTMVRLLRIYGSTAAREIGDSPNFDPYAFVRSSDTLYITASPEKQKEYAPLIAGLLEEIRFATYARHRAEDELREPKRPHVTFVLDEANNTAPIPLPAVVSEAGGQSLHVLVGIQDLSRARNRWGRDADGFLTLFPTKVVLNGVVEPYTLDALSAASGEYDRVMQGYSQSTSYVGPYNVPVTRQNPSWQIQSRRVLLQGDIAQLPPGKALMFIGAQHHLITIGMHYSSPVWQHIIHFAYKQHAIAERLGFNVPTAVDGHIPPADSPHLSEQHPTSGTEKENNS